MVSFPLIRIQSSVTYPDMLPPHKVRLNKNPPLCFVVCSMFWVAGYGDTAFYPSLEDPMSSLTIRNSSSSKFTLEVMSYVSVFVPFVDAYIWYVWRSMDRKKLTPAEISSTDHKY